MWSTMDLLPDVSSDEGGRRAGGGPFRELADEQRQEKPWRSADGPEVSSLDECVSRLWDDNGLAAAMEKPGVAYNNNVDDKLWLWDVILSQVDPVQPVDDLRKDSHLREARSLAKVPSTTCGS